jgi:imidazolonepropionase-like amidohydrolase
MKALLVCWALALPAAAQIAVRGDTVYTMAGPALRDGVVLIRDGKIERVGPAREVAIPSGYRALRARVVTPGLIDAHATVGLSGWLNQPHDQEQVDRSAPVQPELRAIDAYDPRERLVEYLRGFGVTTVHTGHGPGALVSGQTMVVKTAGRTVDEAVVVPEAMIVVTLGGQGLESGAKAPGTRGKAAAMLRGELIRAQEYAAKREKAEAGKEPARDLRLEVLARVLRGDLPLLVTAHKSYDIMTALRLQKEFGFRLVLDGAAESYLVLDAVKAAGVPVDHSPGDAAHLGRGGEPEPGNRGHFESRRHSAGHAERL